MKKVMAMILTLVMASIILCGCEIHEVSKTTIYTSTGTIVTERIDGEIVSQYETIYED